MHNASTLPQPLKALAPGLANAVAGILRSLIALVAHALLKHPRHAIRIVTLCTYINRTHQRFTRLMARLAAGEILRPRPPKPRKTDQKPTKRLPRTHGWLIRAIPNQAACFAGQLAHTLAQPGIAELLATTPQAGRLLRPLCTLLAIDPPQLPAKPTQTQPPKQVTKTNDLHPHPKRLQPRQTRWSWRPNLIAKTA